jgi:acyl carrier protein
MSSEFVVDTKKEILAILDEVLSLKGRSASFSEQTVLLGAIPELDSMAVLALISTLEERFGVVVDDDEIDGATFATVGSLIEFVDQKLAG